MFTIYDSPIGRLTIEEDDGVLCGLWVGGEKGFPAAALEASESARGPVADWLSAYFAGSRPDVDFPIEPSGTDYQREVWSTIQSIPYGETRTYGEIAKAVGARRGKPSAARAVGGALGKNPIMIVIPCHRIVGADGTLTGFAGGIDRKIWLLEHEKATRPSHPGQSLARA